MAAKIMMYTHSSMPIPFLWTVDSDEQEELALRELFYFLDSKEFYRELTEEGLDFHRHRVSTLEELVPYIAENTIPDALQNEARYKIDKLLPEAKETLSAVALQSVFYQQAIGGDVAAIRHLMVLRQKYADETWVILEVKTPDGVAPAKPAEEVKPKMRLIMTDGTEIPIDGC